MIASTALGLAEGSAPASARRLVQGTGGVYCPVATMRGSPLEESVRRNMGRNEFDKIVKPQEEVTRQVLRLQNKSEALFEPKQ